MTEIPERSAVRENLGNLVVPSAQLNLKGLDKQGALSLRTGFVHLEAPVSGRMLLQGVALLELLIPSLIR
jgi:hypothetical protein